MADPHRAGVVAGHAGKEHAAVVRVGAGLARHGEVAELRLLAGAVLADAALEHADEQPRRRLLECLALDLQVPGVQVHLALGVHHAGEGIGFLVLALVGDGAEGGGHLDGGDARRAQREPRAGGGDVAAGNAQLQKVVDRVLNAHVGVQRLRRGGVVGLVDGLSKRLHARVALAREVGRVALVGVPAVDLERRVDHRAARGIPQVKRRAVYGQRLDGRTHRHLALIGAVELLSLRGRRAAADDGDQFARVPVHHRGGGLRLRQLHVLPVAQRGLEGAVGGVTGLRVLVPVRHDLLHPLLDLGVQRGVDAVAAGAQFILHGAAVGGGIFQLLHAQHLGNHVVDGVLDVVGVIIHGGGVGGLFLDAEPLAHGLVVVCLADQVLLQHQPEHVVGALFDFVRRLRGIVVPARVVAVGVSDGARQRRAFAKRQLGYFLAEVVHRGHLDAIVTAAQVDDVQVLQEDIVLGYLLLQLQGKVGFLQFALVVLVGGEHGQLDQLLCDGGAALHVVIQKVRDQRAGDALDVHAVVRAEALVLDGDDRVFQVFGDFIPGGVNAVLRALEVGDQRAVLVINERGLGLLVERRKVKGRRRFNPGLCHAHQKARPGDAQDQHHDEQHLRGRQND